MKIKDEAAIPHLSQGAVRVSAPLHDTLQRWRDEDHEDTVALSREQVIDLCEEYRAAALPHMGGVSVKPLAEMARKIIATPHPETMPGDHLNAAARAQLAFAQIDQFKREAAAALSSLEASPTGAARIAAMSDEELAADRSGENPNVGRIEASPAPVSDLSGQDLQLLDRLKRDNVWDGARPVLEGPRTDPETEQAFRLSDQGYIALEQVARGVRLHITRKGVTALTDALAAKGGQ